MINLTHISKKFHAGKPEEVLALEHINLKIAPADFLVLVGSNGSGKSTLLHLIAGNVLPSSGKVEIAGQDVTTLPEYKRSKHMARVFQNPLDGTASELTVLENFRLAALRAQPKTLKIGMNKAFSQRVKDHVATLGLGLEHKLQQTMGSLSGGQRQALSLLMAVMADIKILLLDEPTAALDPRSAEVVLRTADQLINTYAITAVMVTHNLKEAYQYGNRIIQLHSGKIVRDLDLESKRLLQPTDLYAWFVV